MHIQSHPSILYFGTPVMLISTTNENGTFNLAPSSSVFWLGWRCMVGLAASSKTTQNLLREKECVINLPSVDQADAVNKLARTTGSNPVPAAKVSRGYFYEPDKFERAGLTPVKSATVKPPSVLECPVQLEAVVEGIHELAAHDEAMRGKIIVFEMRIQQVHLEESILMSGKTDHVDPDKWRPLIMSFQEFYGLGSKAGASTLAQIPESSYRTVDYTRALARK
ncbi:NADH-FMN oxidoreductase RutF, flavin reductase (DIM6/NTAB) family [Chitinophaga jiangningensis]|uniref:NADH-FMN oxidoreductase RutF, flavin reductase (DIM6/NTAB) family n=1 Tax=Chitinophaga jiangningensis TaxID=1419482 RepID=A0A1M7CLC6_9BACT|nr:flavin reductase family protein [Chitinophaga jiangningensis]SHL67972.1 NADH-FMN oxidoreductase RutF, flavin reductase (DIM6/NTAB) family [Chitinophaga jiangningensis]